MGINTGGWFGGDPCGPAPEQRIQNTPGKEILFSPNTPPGTIYSHVFTVGPGQVVLIDAYNMPDFSWVRVNRVAVSNYAPIVIDGPCPPCNMLKRDPDGQITFEAPMTLGCEPCWRLFRNSDIDQQLQLMFMVPGMYRLELKDTDMLGDLEVEMQRWVMANTPSIPHNYNAGLGDCCYGGTP